MAWELAVDHVPCVPEAIEDISEMGVQKWQCYRKTPTKTFDHYRCRVYGHYEDLQVFETIHADKNIDYLASYQPELELVPEKKYCRRFDNVINKTGDYIKQHIAIAEN